MLEGAYFIDIASQVIAQTWPKRCTERQMELRATQIRVDQERAMPRLLLDRLR
jgi:hypothetical protein